MTEPPAAPTGVCYHCGERMRADSSWRVQIDGRWRPMCCAGCQAVAEAIVENGLGAYYSTRLASPGRREAVMPPLPARVVDDPLWQRDRVTRLGRSREAVLLLEGMVCPACAWLIEQRIGRLPGIGRAAVNYATQRIRVHWDDDGGRLSEVLEALAQLGYGARVYSSANAETARRAERKKAVWRLFVAALGMMQVMMYAVPGYLARSGDMSSQSEDLMRWASFALTLPVMLWAAAPFFSGALRDLRAKRLGMDVPVSLGIAAAFGASTVALVTGGAVYFDSVTMFIFFLLGGRYLELVARDRAARLIESSCICSDEDQAERLTDYPGSTETETVAVARLRMGDHVLVRRGGAIPADGVLESSTACVDESLLTGESRPVDIARGDAVTGGTLNAAGSAVVRITRTGGDTTRAAIDRLIDQAMAARPAPALLAQRIASRITVGVLLLAAGTCAYWWHADHETAVHAAIAVLVATCPCALALATPLALVAAIARLAADGVIVASGPALESLSRVTRVVFDKTGTLTEGKLEVAQIRLFRGVTREQALGCAAAMEAESGHPVARAIVRAGKGCPRPVISSVAESGTGLSAVVRGSVWGDAVHLRIGTPAFAGRPRSREEAVAADCAGTVAVLADVAGWLAVFTMADRLRDEAPTVLSCLAACGVRASIFSGDGAGPVARIAKALGVSDARWSLTPSDKRAALAAMQAGGEVVAMVGDGVNDAPVLAQSNCGISMSSGATLVQSRADLVLRSDRLAGIVSAFETSKRMRHVIQQNLWWAVAYNLAAVPLAAASVLPAWLAGLGMAASSLIVVLNSCRLLPRVEARAAQQAPAANADPLATAA
jgi:Cu2+-exporting ATPase